MSTARHPVPRARTVAVLTALTLTTIPTVLTGPAPVAAAPGPVTTGPAATVAAATEQARRSGTSVVVDSLGSETETVVADPEGTLTSTFTPAPHRARVDGTWQPVDPTLAPSGDGRIGPRVATVDVRFSAGGDRELVRLRRGDRALALRWPVPLPQPHLDGPVAVYPGALPGVDLRLTAHATGYDTLLVIKDAAAAASEAVRELVLEYETAGLTVRQGDAGDVVAVDDAGATVFEGLGSRMWDSAGSAAPSGAGASASPAATSSPERPDGPLSGDAIGELTVRVDARTMTLRPRFDPRGPAPVFPLFAGPDLPSTGAPLSRWNYVMSDQASASYPQFKSSAGVGRCRTTDGIPCDRDRPGANFVSRIYAKFEPGEKARVWEARDFQRVTVEAWETHAFTCQKRPVDLHLVDEKQVHKGLTWDSRPGNGVMLDRKTVSYGRPDCDHHEGPGWVIFDRQEPLRPKVRDAFRRGDAVAFSLQAQDESDGTAWKRFQGSNLRLRVTYNTPPEVPDGLRTENPAIGCASIDNPAWLTRDTLRLVARSGDADGHRLKTTFQVFEGRGATPVHSAEDGWHSPRSDAKLDIPPGLLKHGKTYRWRAKTRDGLADTNFSRECAFRVDTEAPEAPAVDSTDFADGMPSRPAGQPATFQFTPVGADSAYGKDVTAFAWGINDNLPTNPARATGGGGTTDVTITPAAFGPNDLYVVAVDAAGNRSRLPDRPFRFKPEQPCPRLADDNCAVNVYRFDHTTGDRADDSSGHGQHARLFNATWDQGDRADGADRAVRFRGNGHAEAPTTLHPGNHYTVMARVKLDTLAKNATVLSIPGAHASALALEYQAATRKWAIRHDTRDAVTTDATVASGGAAPTVDKWVHVAATYDAESGLTVLYLDGRQVAQVRVHTQWKPAGTVEVGRQRRGGAWADQLVGAVDDVRLYQGWMYADTVSIIADTVSR